MDLTGIDARLIVTTKFPGLLPEFTPYLQEIGNSLGYVVGVSTMAEEDRIMSLRLVLSPSLVKEPPHFISFPGVHGEEICREYSSLVSLAIVLFAEGQDIWPQSVLGKHSLRLSKNQRNKNKNNLF